MRPPEYVIPVGRSVIVPANASLPNLILSPPAMLRMRRIFAEERFDVIHVHEPYAPILSAFALVVADCPTRRHLPCRRREARLVSDGQANVGNRGRAGRLPDRGLRGGAPGGGALRRRADRRDPERHLPARALRRGRAKRQCRLHRAQRETKGARGAAARMAGGRGQDERAPSCRGRRSAFGALARPPAGALAGAGGSPRRPLRGGADRRAPGGEPPLRARTRRRELRHGADARLRHGDAGRGLRHRGVCGRRGRVERRARPARRSRRGRPRPRRAPLGRAAPRRTRQREPGRLPRAIPGTGSRAASSRSTNS